MMQTPVYDVVRVAVMGDGLVPAAGTVLVRRAVTTVDPETKTRKTILRRLPLESWEVLRRDSHPAYLSWEQFLRNRQRLRENGHVKEGGPRAAREGSALLQGIACCGRCGRR